MTMTPAGNRLILRVADIRAGDWIAEYDAEVLSVAPSDRWPGIREVTFAGQPGVFTIFFHTHVHAVRVGAGPDDDEDDDGQQHDPWPDAEGRW